MHTMLRYRLMMVLLLALLAITAAFAQDTMPQIGTSQENACNEGGLFFRDGATLCETEWHWECGWYIANWQNTGEVVPSWCGTGHLGVSTVSAPPAAYIGCQPFRQVMGGIFDYIDFGYKQVLMSGTLYNYSMTCDDYNPSLITTLTYIYAFSEPEALSICIGQVGGSMV